MIKAIIWSAHEGRGAPYIAVDGDDLPFFPNRSMNWNRRRNDSLPGADQATCIALQQDLGWPEYVYVADAGRIGLVDRLVGWGMDFGLEGMTADGGEPVIVSIDPGRLTP